MSMKRVYICTVLMAACLCLSNARADMYDLTGDTPEHNMAAIDGALFYNVSAASTGSGVIQSFVRIQTNDPIEEGYNTSHRPLEFDENNSPTFTHDLLLSAVPIVNIDGVDYREFLLDINQNKTGPGRLLSLDKLEIYLGSDLGLSGYPSGLGTQIFNLGSGDEGANWLLLDYALNHGSGSGDMFAYIPDELFVGGSYVYLYSMFGASDDSAYPNTASYEEWAVREGATPPPPPPPPVPAPAAVLLGMLGLSAAGCGLRRFA